jgi:SagB-type dehydrogenase family enzyme
MIGRKHFILWEVFVSMKAEFLIIALITIAFIIGFTVILSSQPEQNLSVTCTQYPNQSRIALLDPNFEGIALEKAIAERRSVREYSEDEITQDELSMLLWAGSGITDESGFRTAPSAGALYPIDLYIVPNRVENISCGMYRYVPQDHELVLVKEGQFAEKIYELSYNQGYVKNAGVIILLAATPERTTAKYGEEGKKYVLMEAGHIAQNILLQAVSLDLGAVPIGGFDKSGVSELLELESEVVYMVLVGTKTQ